MSLPAFSTQSELFSTAGLSSQLFAETDRYRQLGKVVYPCLVKARRTLEKCYCSENGRVAIEPVLMLGVSVLQYLDGVPDRQAVEMLRYHAGWNFALNRQIGDEVFHPTSLVNFRNRLEEHKESTVAFKAILAGLTEAGLVSRQSRQRLDSTQMLGRVSRMSRLDCVRETLRLALQELEGITPAEVRPPFWIGLWERYVESQVDYRASSEALARKLVEAGREVWQLLEWLGSPGQAERASGPQAQLLKRVFGEQFNVGAGGPAPLAQEKTALELESRVTDSKAAESTVAPEVSAGGEAALSGGVDSSRQPELSVGPAVGVQMEIKGERELSSELGQDGHALEAADVIKDQGKNQEGPAADPVFEAALAAGEPAGNFIQGMEKQPVDPSDGVERQKTGQEPMEQGMEKPPVEGSGSTPGEALSGAADSSRALETGVRTAAAVQIEPKGKKELSSDRVQNPHEPEATYAVKGQGEKKKEHVGYKIQVAETVCEAVLEPGEPTRNFLMGIVTQPAYESDEVGEEKIEQEQAEMGLEKPPVQYVDGAYVSAEKLVEAQAQGRELIGPAQPAPQKDGRYSAADFKVEVEQRRAFCPAGKESTQCSRLEEQSTGKVNYRFEWSTHCHDCPMRAQCLGKEQRHRTLLVGEHHSALQARRQEQKTEAFQERMKHRNAIEGTQSELVRGHGMRHARYRGLAKVKLQNYFTGAACNVKRWINRIVWELSRARLEAGLAKS